jgi:phosphate transport system substrate-binding protein
MRKLYLILFTVVPFLLIAGCNQSENKAGATDTPESGTIYVSIDESFRPVMEQQIKMYEATYPSTHIIASYKSEVDCFRDFFKDSLNRMIIVGRGLNSKEEHFMMDSLGYNPGCKAIASDAVAIVVNATDIDTSYTMGGLSVLLQGKSNFKSKSVVFDGLNATSTVRYIKDSILKGANYDTSVVRAVKNSEAVIDYVSNHPNAVGLVGISWIGNPEDSGQLKKLNQVKLAYIRCDICEGQPFVKPVQQSILTRRYPLSRPLYYILKENYSGLGTGFSSFLKFERGQLIFRRAYLGPVMDFEIRNVQINQSIP